MAEPNLDLAQVSDPELQANLVRVLKVRGPLGELNVIDAVLPVVLMGQVADLPVTVSTPAYGPGDIFSAGILVTAAANTVHADTGALPEGVYDVLLWISRGTGNSINNNYNIEHRNAANAANVAIMHSIIQAGMGYDAFRLSFAYTLAQDERLRILNRNAHAAGNESYATILARIRT